MHKTNQTKQATATETLLIEMLRSGRRRLGALSIASPMAEDIRSVASVVTRPLMVKTNREYASRVYGVEYTQSWNQSRVFLMMKKFSKHKIKGGEIVK